MPNQSDRKRASEAAKLMLSEANAASAGNVLIDNCHDYTASLTLPVAEDDMDEFPPLPVTPSKPPASKKVMYTHSRSEQDNSNDIIVSLSALINTRSDNIESMVSANALKIEGLEKTVDFACAEIKDMKGKMCLLEKRVAKEEKRVDTCQQRISELERYSRRWNLRLYGVEESEKEDIWRKTIGICQAVLPEQKTGLLIPSTPYTASVLNGKVTRSPGASSFRLPHESAEMLFGKLQRRPPSCRTISCDSRRIFQKRTGNAGTSCGL